MTGPTMTALREFLEECTQKSPDANITVDRLLYAYDLWGEKRQVQGATRKSFVTSMGYAGHKPEKMGGREVFKGLHLRERELYQTGPRIRDVEPPVDPRHLGSRDFTPTAQQISLHGLGFLQVKLPGTARLHVWHPDLPRRSCYAHSAIHNHRFGFYSRVLIGTQVNRRWAVRADADGAYDRISHDGPRSEKGGRLSYVAERVAAREIELLRYRAGSTYHMHVGEYHDTPNDGIVVTLMDKLEESKEHASSLIEHGHAFDQSFDRFQMSQDDMWRIVVDAMRRGA